MVLFKMKKIEYDYLLDIDKLNQVFKIIKKNTRHKTKILKFEIFYTSNIINVLEILKSKKYIHSKYNIFMIKEPKYRIIMSECMTDKIINHLISSYVLFPLLEKKLIDSNVATRTNMGTKMGIKKIKKYINTLKENYNKFYALKCDITKFFYSIDHNILLNKLQKIIKDENIYNIIKNIINSTNYDYVNKRIIDLKENGKKEISKLNISQIEKDLKYKELDKIPLYQLNKGLPIGNMSSQILAIYYLNDLDHFIKEKLKIKYYIRYMDDLILFHHDKEYLKKCLVEIEKKLNNLKLSLNSKTQIIEIHNGICFLGYKFVLKKKKLYVLMNSKIKKRINKKINKISNENKMLFLKRRYNGYLINGNTKGFIHRKIKIIFQG